MREDERKKEQQTRREVEDEKLAEIAGGVERISGPAETEERHESGKEVLDSRLG